MTVRRLITTALVVFTFGAHPVAAAERDPGRVVFSRPAPPDPAFEAPNHGRAAQWVDGERAAAVDASKHPIDFGGLLIAYHNGQPVETCLAQFVSIRLILTSAGCVTDSAGIPWSGPYELYQGCSDREYDRLYVGRCAAVFEAWKGEAAKDYYFDYALIWTPKATRTGRYTVKTPPYVGPLKLYDLKKQKPVTLDGRLGAGEVGATRFKPAEGSDVVEMRGGGWIYKYSTVDSPKKNWLSAVTSHVDKDGVAFGPVFDRAYHDLFRAISGGC